MTSPPTETPAAPFPLVGYADGLVENLRKLVPQALRDWDEQAIHQARVSTRRLKAAIDLFRPVVSDERRRPFARVGRRLRRRLGPLRDLDVMIGHLEKLAANRTHAEAVAWLSQRLRAARERARGESMEKASPPKVLAKLGSWWGLREEIIEAGESTDSLLVESIHLQLDAFAEQANRLSCPPGVDVTETATALDVHQLRIAGKALRYTLEMAREQGRSLGSPVMRTFKRMQEALGLWHDFVVLTEWGMRASLDELLAHHDTVLQAKVLSLARLTLDRAEKQLMKFGQLWTREGRALSETIRTSFPLTKPLTESRTDPGPCETVEPPTPAEPPQGAAPAA